MSLGGRLRETIRLSLVPGAVAGLVGGVFFGLAWIELGVLPSIASLVRADSEVVGLVVHLVIAAIVGAGLGFLLRGRWSPGDIVLWSLAYGAFFWFLGPLTLGPIILGQTPAWDIAAAQAAFPSLLGHLVWGTTAGLALVVIRSRMAPPEPGSDPGEAAPGPTDEGLDLGRGLVVRGLLAGLAGFVVVSLVPVGQARMLSAWGDTGMGVLAPLGPIVIAIGWGLLFAIAHPRSAPTAGATVVRGAGFGFLLWVIGGLTVLPVLAGRGLDWAIPEAQAAFPTFVASILFGTAMALTFHWLTRLTPILFSDADPDAPPDGGSWGLRAVIRGGAAGLVGGLVFTLVMIQIGFLPAVAELVGSESELVGLVVHLLIAVTIGATYGALFRRTAFDAGAAIGWGASYGFVWWLLGPLTLAPVILGASPAWSVEAAGTAFPGLVGHLAYGAALGLTFHLLEARYTPWWISRTEREVRRMAGRRQAAGSAGPALWALLVLVAVLLPTVLASGPPSDGAGPYSPVGEPYVPPTSSTTDGANGP